MKDLTYRDNGDSLEQREIRFGPKLDFMGIGYHDYDYPLDNFSLTASGEMILDLKRREKLKLFFSAGAGATTIHPIGYASFSSGALLGKKTSFFRIAGAFAMAFTEHEIYWHIQGYNGGITGSERISYGVQCIPVLGYSFVPQNGGIATSIYISPHFAMRTYEAPGHVATPFWVSAGISAGYMCK